MEAMQKRKLPSLPLHFQPGELIPKTLRSPSPTGISKEDTGSPAAQRKPLSRSLSRSSSCTGFRKSDSGLPAVEGRHSRSLSRSSSMSSIRKANSGLPAVERNPLSRSLSRGSSRSVGELPMLETRSSSKRMGRSEARCSTWSGSQAATSTTASACDTSSASASTMARSSERRSSSSSALQRTVNGWPTLEPLPPWERPNGGAAPTPEKQMRGRSCKSVASEIVAIDVMEYKQKDREKHEESQTPSKSANCLWSEGTADRTDQVHVSPRLDKRRPKPLKINESAFKAQENARPGKDSPSHQSRSRKDSPSHQSRPGKDSPSHLSRNSPELPSDNRSSRKAKRPVPQGLMSLVAPDSPSSPHSLSPNRSVVSFAASLSPPHSPGKSSRSSRSPSHSPSHSPGRPSRSPSGTPSHSPSHSPGRPARSPSGMPKTESPLRKRTKLRSAWANVREEWRDTEIIPEALEEVTEADIRGKQPRPPSPEEQCAAASSTDRFENRRGSGASLTGRSGHRRNSGSNSTEQGDYQRRSSGERSSGGSGMMGEHERRSSGDLGRRSSGDLGRYSSGDLSRRPSGDLGMAGEHQRRSSGDMGRRPSGDLSMAAAPRLSQTLGRRSSSLGQLHNHGCGHKEKRHSLIKGSRDDSFLTTISEGTSTSNNSNSTPDSYSRCSVIEAYGEMASDKLDQVMESFSKRLRDFHQLFAKCHAEKADLLQLLFRNQGMDKLLDFQCNAIPVVTSAFWKAEQNTIVTVQGGAMCGKTSSLALGFLGAVGPDTTGLRAVVLSPSNHGDFQKYFDICSVAHPMRLECFGNPNASERYEPRHVDPLKDLKRLSSALSGGAPAIVFGHPARVLTLLKGAPAMGIDLSGVQVLALDDTEDTITLGLMDEVCEVCTILRHFSAHKLRYIILSRFLTHEAKSMIRRLRNSLLRQVNLFGIDVQVAQAQIRSAKQYYAVLKKQHWPDVLARIHDALSLPSGIIFDDDSEKVRQKRCLSLNVKGVKTSVWNQLTDFSGLSESLRGDASPRMSEIKFHLMPSDLVFLNVDLPRVKCVLHFDVPRRELSVYGRRLMCLALQGKKRCGSGSISILFVTEVEVVRDLEKAYQIKMEELEMEMLLN